MRKSFTPLKSLALVVMLFVTSAAADPVVKDLETPLSDYLTAIYARQLGDVDRATQNYLRAVEQDPENLTLLEEAYTYFVYVGDFKRGLDLARRLQSLDADHSSSAMLLALEAFKRGRAKDLAEVLPKAKGLGFEFLMSPLMTAWLLAKDKKTDKAFEAMAELKDNPGFEPFYAENYAFMLDQAGKENEAEVAYLALLARPEISSLQPLFAYGAFLQKKKRSKEALKLFQDFQPAAATNLQLADAIKRLESGQTLETIVKDPSKAVAMAMLRTGVQLTRERAFYPGVIYARFALYLDPEFDEGLLFLGNLLSSETYPGLALEAYGAVNPEGPFAETALLRQAMVYSFHDQSEQGITLVKDYLKDNSNSYEALVTLGDLYRANEDYHEALPYYEKAAALKETLGREDWFLIFTRAIAYERLDMWEKAEADFLMALNFEPENPDILNYLGYSWIDRGMNLEEGRQMIEKAVELSPDNGFILDSLGWAQYLMGEFEEAVENLERAVSLEPGDPTINDHLGDAYWKVGRQREARFQWDHALNLEPENDVVEKLKTKMTQGLEDDSDLSNNL